MKFYQIGQFSTITRLTIKALRFYQEKGILEPGYIDEQTGYRYYSENQLERALTIQNLKSLEFSLKEISEIMKSFNDDSEMISFLKEKSAELESKMAHVDTIKNQLDYLVAIQEKQIMKTYQEKIETRQLPSQLVCSIRFQGKYSDVGTYFKKLFKLVGFHVAGKPGSLYYDREYKQDDADIEAFIPVKKSFKHSAISSKSLPGGKAHCLVHIGSYQTLNRSYKKLMDYLEEKKISVANPIREIYLKGPGMIFRGNPDKYITEIQFLETEAD